MTTRLRILLVEDSESDAALLERTLRRGGYAPDVVRVETGPTMLAALADKPFDIILSDHDLPEFSSLSALEVRNENRPDLPFIIVSGRIGEELIVTAIKSGAQDYVLKHDLSRVVPAIERALREAASAAEKRGAEEALRVSEERYALAVRGSSDGVWDWNLVTGQVYYAPRFKDLLGFEDHEFGDTTRALEERIHPEDLDRMLETRKDHLERRLPYISEFRVLTKRGEYRWFCSRGQALWDGQGRPTRMAGSLSDLTEQKRVEAELREKLEIIERQQEDIRVLGTPIIEVWDGVLMTPVLGTLDRDRASALMESLLRAVVSARCRDVILDLTGVEEIDAVTAEYIVRLVVSVELLGAEGIVVGIQPRVAQTIVGAGIDLSRIRTIRNLREALLLCMRRRKQRRAQRQKRD